MHWTKKLTNQVLPDDDYRKIIFDRERDRATRALGFWFTDGFSIDVRRPVERDVDEFLVARDIGLKERPYSYLVLSVKHDATEAVWESPPLRIRGTDWHQVALEAKHDFMVNHPSVDRVARRDMDVVHERAGLLLDVVRQELGEEVELSIRSVDLDAGVARLVYTLRDPFSDEVLIEEGRETKLRHLGCDPAYAAVWRSAMTSEGITVAAVLRIRIEVELVEDGLENVGIERTREKELEV